MGEKLLWELKIQKNLNFAFHPWSKNFNWWIRKNTDNLISFFSLIVCKSLDFNSEAILYVMHFKIAQYWKYFPLVSGQTVSQILLEVELCLMNAFILPFYFTRVTGLNEEFGLVSFFFWVGLFSFSFQVLEIYMHFLV